MAASICALIAAIVFTDQIFKFLILKYLSINTSCPVIPRVFSITPILNTGGGFGILRRQTVFLTTVSVLAVIAIFYILHKRKINSRLMVYALAMISGGAIGNIIDRIRFGAVIDFFDFKIWPVFNIADSFITIGALLLAYSVIARSKG